MHTSANRISRTRTKQILEEVEIDNRNWFTKAMDAVAGVDY